jgi:serine/threonine protein phosphatase PrpC
MQGQQVNCKMRKGFMNIVACVAFFTKEDYERVLYIANVGDTRAVISNDTLAQRLSYEDRCSDIHEIERIRYSLYLGFLC